MISKILHLKLGLGLSTYIPLAIYLLAIIVIILTIFYKTRIGIYFLIPLFPLQNVFKALHPFPYGKDFVDVLLIAIIIGWFVRSNGKIFEKTPFNKILLFFVIFTYISLWYGSLQLGLEAPISPTNERFQDWKNYMILPLLFFITVNNIRELGQIKLLTLFMTIVIFYVDYHFFNNFGGFVSDDFSYSIRKEGTFGYAGVNCLGAFFAQYTLLLICLFLFDKGKIWRSFLMATILFNTYCLLASFSRGAYLATLIGLFFLGVVKERKLLVLLALFFVVWTTILPMSVVDRIMMTTSEQGTLEASAGSRLDLWSDALGIFQQNFVIGTGFGTYRYTSQVSGGYADTHNMYMKFLAELGIIGISIFLFLFYLALKSGWQLYTTANDRFLKGLGLGFTSCVITCMVTNVFGDRWTYQQLSAYYWVFLGLVVRGKMIVQQSSFQKELEN